MGTMGFLEVMKERSLLVQITHEDELIPHLSSGKRTAYVGFDTTADSLHAGHLMGIMNLMRWQQAGHRAIALIGGGTASVGDPTGRTEMRQMLEDAELQRNTECIKKQLETFIDTSSPDKGLILNNIDWLSKLQYLPFIREIGRHFSVNRMLTAECFKQRLEKGLSFLEFNYMLLQSYDFLHLYNTQGCTVQLGGDDQWSNMLGGVELVRRLSEQKGGKAFCLTWPLLTTSDGIKMGKTAAGAVWLDAKKTSPYDYFQFWRNVEDAKVETCLKYMTFLPTSEVKRLAALKDKEINEAKKVLAYEATKIAHGKEAADGALKSAEKLFSGSGGGIVQTDGSEPCFKIKRSAIQENPKLVDILLKENIFPSKGEVRRFIQQGGLYINGQKIEDIEYKLGLKDFREDSGTSGEGKRLFCLVQKGRKHYYRLIISDH